MSSTPPRRFKVEPIETTAKSSKDRSQKDASKPRKFAAEPFEFTKKATRKFAPEPIETTAKSNRNKDTQGATQKPARRFKPELVETTEKRGGEVRDKPRIGVSTTSTSNDRTKRPPRKFAPQLIETAKRTRKAGDSTPAILASDKTEATPGDSTTGPRRVHTDAAPPPPDNTPVLPASQNPFFLEVQRQASPLSMRRPSSRASTRSHHSFRVPELDPIESSESEGESPASPSTSPSVTSDHSFMYKEATRMRESVDERFSGYLLELAAKAAEKQLREQAMAAFPNDDHHEPVDHFIGRDDDMESQAGDAKLRHDSSFTEVNWELVAMRQYREEAEKEKREADERRKKREAEMNKPEAQSHNPWGNASVLSNLRQPRDPEMDGMRKGARPPMLGSDIVFPRCPSPEPARFDPTQGSHAIKSAMCYLTEQTQASERGEGLWCGNGKQLSIQSNAPTLWGSVPSRPPSRGGLWGGCCINSGLTPPRGPTGILTPKIEIDNPMSPCPTPDHEQLPPTPPASQADFACIDEKLSAELAIEEEFGDDFVTQVYNYLSLGYPSIARVFDEELVRISQWSLEELRQDDNLVTSRGYIRLGVDGNLKNTDITEESCMRWRALRVYIREWAKQQPGMVSGDSNANVGMGAAVRRGSWAF
ncbi:hypothetical protein BDV96DRAFT_488843 [Lophiotrema nucula]|uniref:Uncharacterized protein n=1 Tax=Lophiotrema nucula TaxID=690887 RepID=A0A6A5ZGU8_9PLEO|nr:hypothetical protein BDV96DRAFT_488843 [Lophiotrema nucula]